MIKELKNETFSNLPKLNLLSLSNNIISSVNTYAFSNSTSLTNLSLQKNNIQYIPDFDFMNLTYLDLSYNKIKIIENHLFSEEFKNLKSINFSNNELSQIEPFQYNPNIEVIDLRNNSIGKFSNEFKWFYNKNFNDTSSLNSTKIYLEPQKDKKIVFDDSTIKQYNICDSFQFETVYNRYFKAFFTEPITVICNCSTQKRVISDLKRLSAEKNIKCFNDSFFNDCDVPTNFSYCNDDIFTTTSKPTTVTITNSTTITIITTFALSTETTSSEKELEKGILFVF
jgi:hypothetical protein